MSSDAPSISVSASGETEYRLNPNTTFRRRQTTKLDSSDYAGEVIYRQTASERTAPSAGTASAVPADGAGLSNGHIRSLLVYTEQEPQVEIWRGGSLVHCQRESKNFCVAPTKRGEVHGFSRKSRSRMIATQAKIRWNTERAPYFMGNTCPNSVPAADQVIAAWAKFSRRFERRFPQGALLWRKEIKDRKRGACEGQWVPHYHSFAYNCARKFEFQEERGQWVRLHQRKDGGWTLKIYCLNASGQKVLHRCEEMPAGVTDRLAEWWSRNWYEAMGSGEIKHYLAGTSCEQIQTVEGVRFYTAKYMAKVQDADQSEHCKGRWWGMVARQNIPWAERVVIKCTDSQAVTLMRILRRYVLGKAKRKFRCHHQSMNYLVSDPSQWERLVDWVLKAAVEPF